STLNKIPWNHNDLTLTAGVPLAAGDPAGYTWDFDKSQHVVYRSNDGHIYELWLVGVGNNKYKWYYTDLTLATGAPIAAGNPTSYTWDADKSEHVVYKGTDDHIYELWLVGVGN